MKFVPFLCCLSLCCLIAGCVDDSTALGDPPPDDSKAADSTGKDSALATENGTDASSNEKTMGRKVDLSPANTSIEFVGVHTDKSKDDRHGSFQDFSGAAMVDQTLMSVQVDIDTTSLTTDIEKLTNHLKSADFFDVNRYPKARFESTEVVDKEDGTVEITGDLTLLDKTNSITFPATVNAEGELELEAKFEIDRTKWGMDHGTDGVEKMVGLTIKIGK